MASSHILQIFLRVTVQNQIRIAKRVIIDKIIQFRPLRHGHVQCILDPGAVVGHTAVGNEPELVGARPLHLAGARPLCRLKAPLGLSLLRNRGILLSEENKKSKPFSYREKVRIFIVWCE